MTAARQGLDIVKQTFKEFTEDECPRMAAALAYYTVFSLPPLLVLIILLAGAVWGADAVQGKISTEMAGLLGPEGAEQVQTMIRGASEKLSGSGGLLTTLLGIGALVFGATGAFAQLQDALNRAWEVEPDPEAGGVKNFIVKRGLSFGMILAVAFLLLVSLVLSALITVVGEQASGLLPDGLSAVFLEALNFGVSLGIITLLFAALYRVLPDAEVDWKDVWVGAGVTALLFVVGKFGLGIYLGRSDPGSAFGAAGSLALILVWIYYSSMILFLGAEFTQVWTRAHGGTLRPAKGAVRSSDKKQPLRAKPDRPDTSHRKPAPASDDNRVDRVWE